MGVRVVGARVELGGAADEEEEEGTAGDAVGVLVPSSYVMYEVPSSSPVCVMICGLVKRASVRVFTSEAPWRKEAVRLLTGGAPATMEITSADRRAGARQLRKSP